MPSTPSKEFINALVETLASIVPSGDDDSDAAIWVELQALVDLHMDSADDPKTQRYVRGTMHLLEEMLRLRVSRREAEGTVKTLVSFTRFGLAIGGLL